MKRLLMLIPLVFLCCLGCQQGEGPATVDVEADIQAIKDVVAEWSAAFNAADVDKIFSYYADEVVRIPPNEPALTEKEAIRSKVQQAFDEYTAEGKDIVENVEVSGDLAVAHTTYKYVVTSKTGQDSVETKGNEILVLKKQANGTWKFTYLIWSDEGLIRPQLTE